MTNSFADIANPATLRAMVQNGAECETCHGRHPEEVLAPREYVFRRCPTCANTGHTPLSNANLEALAACWCEGNWLDWDPHKGLWKIWTSYYSWWSISEIPAYTISPDAAMRLLVKYKLQPKVIELQGKEYWYVLCGAGSDDCSVVEGVTIEALCQALTEAALIVALTEMEGDSDAGD